MAPVAPQIEFDLSGIVRWESDQNRTRNVVQFYGLLAVGVVLFVAGVVLLADGRLPLVGRLAGGLLFIGMGVALPLVGGSPSRQLGKVPDRLVVSDDGVEYGWLAGGDGELCSLEWSDPALRMELLDRQAVRDRIGTRDRSSVYALWIPKRSLMLPLTREAYDAIADRARALALLREPTDVFGVMVAKIGPIPTRGRSGPRT